MTSVINRSGILWAVGVLQPVSALELNAYLSSVLQSGGVVPSGQELHRFLLESSDRGHVVRVFRDPDLFSLSQLGNVYLTRLQRINRDRERIFLLHDSWSNRVRMSREGDAGLGGEAPPLDNRIGIKGSGANKSSPVVPRVQTYWPRISRQLTSQTGPLGPSRDNFLEYLSFDTERHLELATGGMNFGALNVSAIALIIGISPKLITQMLSNPKRHYRTFDIDKSNGKVRTINSPRVFLKVIQRFMLDYIFCDLRVHDCVHSFRADRSILTNAQSHLDSRWLGMIDIHDFFGSIDRKAIEKLLFVNGFDFISAGTLARLATLDNSLPQGAPTSPILSNALLYEFDVKIAKFALENGTRYSRYADDIAVSGADRSQVEAVLNYSESLLKTLHALSINEDKTRIVGRNSRQVVTGVVVNKVALPPRKLRRNIRAAAFNASRKTNTIENLQMLAGYLNYFDSFPDFADNEESARIHEYFERAKRQA